jgi:hypothetical protein
MLAYPILPLPIVARVLAVPMSSGGPGHFQALLVGEQRPS